MSICFREPIYSWAIGLIIECVLRLPNMLVKSGDFSSFKVSEGAAKIPFKPTQFFEVAASYEAALPTIFNF